MLLIMFTEIMSERQKVRFVADYIIINYIGESSKDTAGWRRTETGNLGFLLELIQVFLIYFICMYIHLRTGLSKSEDVIDEQQYVLTLLVAEVLGNGESGESYSSTGAWRLVHLSVHQRYLGGLVFERDDPGLDHLVIEIVAFTRSLTHTGKH